MLDWLKKRLHRKKVADQLQRHMGTAVGSSLQRSAIAVAMTAIEDELVQEERGRLSTSDQEVFMMVYECLVMWSQMRGFASAGIPERVQADVVAAMRDHFARHAWYAADDFKRIWDKTQEWMPSFVKPDKDGTIWPVAARVQISHAAGCQLGFMPGTAFGYHLISVITSLADIARHTGEEQLKRGEKSCRRKDQPKMSSVAHQAIQTARERLGMEGRESALCPTSLLGKTLEEGSKLVVDFYRELGAYNKCPPTAKTSDQKIIEIYSLVCTAFQETAKRRGEQIPAEFLNRIVSSFLQIYENMGEDSMHEHLQYETDKYLREGLRPDYRHPLRFFSDESQGEPIALTTKGKTLAKQGQPEQAIACFNKALAADPELAVAWFGKDEVLFHLGRQEEAKACFDKALRIDPQCVAHWVAECFDRAQERQSPGTGNHSKE